MLLFEQQKLHTRSRQTIQVEIGVWITLFAGVLAYPVFVNKF